jgi:hypothetical protein
VKHPAPQPLPLFVSAEITALEQERDRLAAALKRMRQKRRYGAIQRTEFRLQTLTGQILAVAYRKEQP